MKFSLMPGLPRRLGIGIDLVNQRLVDRGRVVIGLGVAGGSQADPARNEEHHESHSLHACLLFVVGESRREKNEMCRHISEFLRMSTVRQIFRIPFKKN